MEKNLEEGQIVLCTVTKIIGTTVFVKIVDYDKEGTIRWKLKERKLIEQTYIRFFRDK